MISFGADYFDGKSSKKMSVILKFDDEDVEILGEEFKKTVSLKDLTFSSRLANTPREITLRDGAMIYSSENDKIDKIIKMMHKNSNLIHVLESKKRYVVMTLFMLVATILLLLTTGSEVIAKGITKIIPYSIEKKISDKTLEVLDSYILLSSKLESSKKDHIEEIFKKVTKNEPHYKIHFRRGVSENAFALPSGDIIITDELISFSENNDDMIYGVLAHEMGHVRYKHSMKNLIKFAITSSIISFITGDISSLVTILSTSIINAKYSRDYESQADRYAKTRMVENHIDPKHLANFFIKLKKKTKNGDKQGYFSSHPDSQDRIDKLLKKD